MMYGIFMKPLFHPSIHDITVEGVLYALSDPVRVRIFVEIAGCEGHKNCTTFRSINSRDIPKSTLSQHFKILREAGLVRSVRNGVELHNTTRCSELKDRFGPMISEIIAAYAAQDKKRKPRALRA
jgi:DNA-binding transcriptional ArsR family regulator